MRRSLTVSATGGGTRGPPTDALDRDRVRDRDRGRSAGQRRLCPDQQVAFPAFAHWIACGLPNDEPSTLNVMLKPWLLVSKTYVYPPDGGGPLFWAVQSVGGVLLLTRSTVLRLASASIRCLLPFTQARMKPLT